MSISVGTFEFTISADGEHSQISIRVNAGQALMKNADGYEWKMSRRQFEDMLDGFCGVEKLAKAFAERED